MNKLIKKIIIGLSAVLIVVSLMEYNILFAGSGEVVERVSDGDTLVLRGADNQKFTVRLACVDAPEIPHTNKEKNSRRVRDINQFNWGVKAQIRVQELVKQSGDRVKLDIIESDRYGRKLAEVRLKNGTFIQQVLLEEGLAKVYRPYLTKCPSKDIIQQAEAQAQQQKLGVWNDRKFVDPWEYRKFRKAN
ncbi:thermonuclease family protein [Anabaena aphanizomenioides LEGE 00250]|uniref:Nuclease n=2 Tax=Sphaerospermopsis TaxID=752201 RepID=A0A479ZX51_9CYAN|nr:MULTISPECIES: thermonuclease family protein [Sphaerospermopsis]MBE9236292.1 thermonuclease family protein [Sphaerospermopsis aphanizomenoides LEGE 00250]GCL36146.1 nuclease [Sphaerospermopsis reniformis]